MNNDKETLQKIGVRYDAENQSGLYQDDRSHGEQMWKSFKGMSKIRVFQYG
jgi:hypothetical protein